MRGTPVPSGNELVYLLAPYRAFHPGVLPGDWTFSRSWSEHWLFHNLVGVLSLILPLPVLGWAGRLAYWILGLAALLRLGRRFGLSDGQTSLAIAVWLGAGQTLFGADWLFKTFEAKSVAYVLLLYSLDTYLAGRSTLAAALLGLCFSFHPSVGASAALGFGAVLLGMRAPPATLARFAGITFVFSLPGLIPLAASLGPPGVDARSMWRVLALIRMPSHLDALSFPRRDLLEGYLLFGFCWLHARRHPEDRALQLSRWFLAGLALLCTAGLIARATGRYELLRVFPFRVFPLLTPLLALFQMQRAYRDLTAGVAQPKSLAAVALLGIMGLPNPVGGAVDQMHLSAELRRPPDDLARAFDWLARNTPADARVIVPPWRKDSFYRSRRSQIVAWDPAPPDQPEEWRRRMEVLVGPLEESSDTARLERMEAHYDRLTEAEIEALRREYGGDYLVSRGAYPWQVRFQSGEWRVYRLSP